MADTDLVFGIREHMRAAVPMAGFTTYFDWLKALRSLSAGMLTLEHVWKLDAEVNNGGFDQYFINTGGRVADQTLQALERIGACHRAAILHEAVRIVGEGSIPDESISLELRALDDRYFELSENVHSLLADYIRAHPEEFIRP